MNSGSKTGNLSSKRELSAVLIVAGIILITVFLVYVYIFNFLPRTGNLISIYGSDGNFQKIRDEITKANQVKLTLEKSLRNEEDKIRFDGKDIYHQKIISMAKSGGLEILSFEELGSVVENGYLKSTIMIEIAGFYQNLNNYIMQIETGEFPVTIRSLDISTSNSITTNLECELSLIIFRNVDE